MTDVSVINDTALHTVDTNSPDDRIHVTRGIYLSVEEAQDRLYYLQTKYSRGVFSYDTALFLYGYIDKLERITMTFPQGYNVLSLKCEDITVKKLIPENYTADIEEIRTANGNLVRVYSIERTLCDMLRGSRINYYAVTTAMQQYLSCEDRRPEKMLEIADRLRVRPKVMPFVEAMLQG